MIVSNPPWVKISSITVERRHRRLQDAAEQNGLWSGGMLAPHFDIATLFLKRCRELYLAPTREAEAGWVVKASAINQGIALATA